MAKSKFLETAQSDFYRLVGRKASAFTLFKEAVLLKRYRAFTYNYWFRMAQYGRGPFKLLGILMHKRWSTKLCVDINRAMEVGSGFYLSHGICIVIGANTKIGDNVNISQFVNIGTNNKKGAVIGNNVYVGPHACIVGDVKIGNNVTIGAGAVVTHDIPDGATVVGVPAKVINYDNPARFINHPYRHQD